MGTRGLRAAVFAVVCVGLAAAAHVLGGGVPPGRGALLLGFAAVFAPAAALAGRERRMPGIGAALLLAQAMLHLLFGAAHGGGAVALPRHVHDCSLLSGPDTAMTFAHLWAVLVTAWWLARGEAALWALARLAARGLARPFRTPAAPPVVTPVRPIVITAPRPAPRRVDHVRHAVRRRGPPAVAAR